MSPSKKQRVEEPMHKTIQRSIKLTPPEEKLFSFLLDVAADSGTVLRVAGGWVRDKLLGRESDDVDIVLDRMTGQSFANLVNSYETAHGRKARTVGVIKANPEQSKHLETATLQIGEGMGWVDFVNLRAETYVSEDHRIPTVAIGTPQQDAERRDFTINSLFYNLATKEVEDFTGRGLEDLNKRQLRTPLEPQVTFLDDPLRVLRAVRFASRFQCILDEELRAAAQSEEVRAALLRKVSRERVGKELCGMITGRAAHPERAFHLLHDLNLCDSVFLPSILLEKTPICRPDGQETSYLDDVWDRSCLYVSEMYKLVAARAETEVLDVDSLSMEEKYELQIRIFASVLLPFRGLCVRDKRRRSIAEFVVHDSLKLPNREAKDIDNVLTSVEKMQVVTTNPFDRVEVGLLLRTFRAHWELCRDVALVQELTDSKDTATVSTRYNSFTTAVREADLDNIWELKPLVNGNDLVKLLGVKPGPHMKELLDSIIAWQLANPKKTRDDCLVHCKTLIADGKRSQ